MELDGITARLSDIVLTGTGLRFSVEGSGERPIGQIAAVLTDGTEINADMGIGFGNGDDSEVMTVNWKVPVNLDDVAAVRIGKTEIPVK